MKIKIQLAATLLLSMLVSSACSDNDTVWGQGGTRPPGEVAPVAPPVNYEAIVAAAGFPAASQPTLVARAQELAAALKTDTYRSGVYLYGSSRVYSSPNNAAQLAARLKLLGVTDVYNYVERAALRGTNANQHTWFKEFNAMAHHYGMRVWALSFMEPTDYTNTGTYAELTDRVRAVQEFNAVVKPNEVFDAYSLDYEPHILTAGQTKWPPLLPKTPDYTWIYTGGQGVPGPNNTLLGITLDMCSAVRSLVGDAPVHEAISYIFQRDYDKGQYSYGSAVQFLESCDNIVVMAYEKTSNLVWSTSQGILNNAKTKAGSEKTVSLCLKVDVNSDGTDFINPRKWAHMISIVNDLNGPAMGQTQSAYAGVDFFAYAGLQQIWFDLEP